MPRHRRALTPPLYASTSRRHLSPQLIATACVFLAFKVEEAHQKVKPVINCSRDVWGRGSLRALDAEEFLALRQTVLDSERVVLYSLEFDVGVVHPYGAIQTTLTLWKEAGVFEPTWPRTAKNSAAPREVVAANTLARNLAFSLLATSAALRFVPLEVAVAALTCALDISFANAALGPSPVRRKDVVQSVGSEAAARQVIVLRERIPDLLDPLVTLDSAVRAASGRIGGVAPIAATIRENGVSANAESNGASTGASTAAVGVAASGGGGDARALQEPALSGIATSDDTAMLDDIGPQLD